MVWMVRTPLEIMESAYAASGDPIETTELPILLLQLAGGVVIHIGRQDRRSRSPSADGLDDQAWNVAEQLVRLASERDPVSFHRAAMQSDRRGVSAKVVGMYLL